MGETGVALIFVDDAGENEIVTVPGANWLLTPRAVEGAVLCQLEVPGRGRAAPRRRTRRSSR